ncbi:IclR family transcriptional regulator [Microbacterium sp. A94]|uniref:IclR family transcriptional regulator n=1 Tax=Microbacterium sp. A94 TaxID=3450717 RepID=UPI003F6E13A5
MLTRILSILDAVKSADGAISVTQIAYATDIPKSTAARLVSELVSQRYLVRGDGGISLGLRLFELGARATMPRRLVSAAAPIMSHLAQRTGERVGLWVQQGTDMVSLAAAPGRLPMLPTWAGMRSPALTTASGKAFLAFCEDERVIDLVSAPLIAAEMLRFRRELTDVRSSMLATDSGASYRGVLAVASPIIGSDSSVIGAISVAGPSDAMRPDNVAPLVRAAGVSLAKRLPAA